MQAWTNIGSDCCYAREARRIERTGIVDAVALTSLRVWLLRCGNEKGLARAAAMKKGQLALPFASIRFEAGARRNAKIRAFTSQPCPSRACRTSC
jgi:hypothetical protein